MAKRLTLENLARWNGWVTTEEEYQRRQAFYLDHERRVEEQITQQMNRVLEAVRG